MLKSTKLYCSLALLLLAVMVAPAARADSFTYAFDYNGIGIGSTVQGKGQFTYDSVTRDLTAFTFSDTFSGVFGQSLGTFAYTLADVFYQGMLLAPDGTLGGINITTGYKTATSGNYGQANFIFSYALGLNPDATTGNRLGTNTAGSGSIRLLSPSPTPEPSSLMLLGTGILAVAGVARRKLRA